MPSKKLKTGLIVGGAVVAIGAAIAGTVVAVKKKQEANKGASRNVFSFPTCNVSVLHWTGDGSKDVQVGAWVASVPGPDSISQWDQMIDLFWNAHSSIVLPCDYADIYDALLSGKMTYAHKYFGGYPAEMQTADRTLRDSRLVAQPTLSPVYVAPKNTLTQGVLYGCLGPFKKSATVDSALSYSFDIDSIRPKFLWWKAKTWYGPIVQYNIGASNSNTKILMQDKYDIAHNIVGPRKYGVNLFGWDSGMFENKSELLTKIQADERKWNTLCGGECIEGMRVDNFIASIATLLAKH